MAHASFWERKIAEAKRHWRRVSDHLRTRTKGGFRLHIRRSTILSDREGSDWALTAFDVLISFPGRTHEPSRQELPLCATT
jgi:hypothetical protein